MHTGKLPSGTEGEELGGFPLTGTFTQIHSHQRNGGAAANRWGDQPSGCHMSNTTGWETAFIYCIHLFIPTCVHVITRGWPATSRHGLLMSPYLHEAFSLTESGQAMARHMVEPA